MKHRVTLMWLLLAAVILGLPGWGTPHAEILSRADVIVPNAPSTETEALRSAFLSAVQADAPVDYHFAPAPAADGKGVSAVGAWTATNAAQGFTTSVSGSGVDLISARNLALAMATARPTTSAARAARANLPRRSGDTDA